MAQLPFINGATFGVIRTNINTMFTELYAAIVTLTTTVGLAIPGSQKGAANGIATLGADTKVPTSQLTGKLAVSDTTDGLALLASKQSVALNWNGTTPALASGTNPVPAFGSNAFVYTGAGGAVLDGNTYQTGDLALWNGSVFTCTRLGGGYVGTFASTSALQTAYPAASNPTVDALVAGILYKSDGTVWQKRVGASTDLSDSASIERVLGPFVSSAALQTAFPAASNTGNKGLVGSAAPYTNYSSNGSAWVKGISASTDLSDGATLNALIATNTNATVQITGNVVISVANNNFATYNGKTLEFTGAYSVTVGAGGPTDFGFAGIPPASGNASIVSDGTTTFNGSTTTQTRAYATQSMFTVTQRSTNHNQYVVV